MLYYNDAVRIVKYFKWNDDDDLIDMVNDAIYKAREKFDASRGVKLNTFIMRYAKQAYIEYVRALKRKNRHMVKVSQTRPSVVSDTVKNIDNKNLIQSFFHGNILTKQQKEVLQLMYDGYTQAEIAEKFNVTTQAISFHFVNIKKALAKYATEFNNSDS